MQVRECLEAGVRTHVYACETAKENGRGNKERSGRGRECARTNQAAAQDQRGLAGVCSGASDVAAGLLHRFVAMETKNPADTSESEKHGARNVC